MDLSGSEYNQGNWAEKFGFVVQIILTSCGPDIFNSKDTNALKLTCKATRLAVQPLFTSLYIMPKNAISLEQFISACHGTSLLPWNLSHVEVVYLDAGNVTLKTLKVFMALHMPNLKTLTVSNSRHPTLFAQGDWPQLTCLKFSFSKKVEKTVANDGGNKIKTNGLPALVSLKLAFKEEKSNGARKDFPLLLSNILATYSHPKVLKLNITNLKYISLIPTLAAASLPLLEEFKILGSADNPMNEIAMAKNWPNIRHLVLGDLGAFGHLDLHSSAWIKQLEKLDISGEFQFKPEILSTLLESLHGGRLQMLHLCILTIDFREFRGLRSSYLPHLTELSLTASNDEQEDYYLINQIMDAIFNARFPLLSTLNIYCPRCLDIDKIQNLWSLPPSKSAKTAFPNLGYFGIGECSLSGNVVQYLKDLHLAGCNLGLSTVKADKIVQLSEELETLMDELSFLN